jgi:hypothetical protein
MNPSQRTYMGRFLASLIAYVILLIASLVALNQWGDGLPDVGRIAIALLPVVPVLFGMWALMRWIGSLDEMQRRIQLEAFAFSLGMTGIVTFTLGFVSNAGVPSPDMIWVLPMMVVFWGFGQAIASRRYD